MHFSVVFGGNESCDVTFGMVFIPSACWVRGNETIVNLSQEREGTNYTAGDLQRLFNAERTLFAIEETQQDDLSAVIVVHASGHGRNEDLELLQSDLESAGYAVIQVSLAEE